MEAAKEILSACMIIMTLLSGVVTDVKEDIARERAKAESGKALRKSVYMMESGSRVTGRAIKKAGGAAKYFRVYKISKGSRVYKRIYGKSLPESGMDVSGLRYLKLLYRDFDGKTRIGEMIVSERIAGKVRRIFYKLYKVRYQIKSMKLVDDYFPESFTDRQQAARIADDSSMDADNTSAFNYRYVLGTSQLSSHSYGTAIDVNPFENPYCFNKGGKWVAASNQVKSSAYLNRVPSPERQHMILTDSDITKLFKEEGFRWLGEGNASRDYQHFEYPR